MKNEYIFERNKKEQELIRLRMVKEALDPTTVAHLKDVEKYIDNANNDRFWAVYYSTVTVIATSSSTK